MGLLGATIILTVLNIGLGALVVSLWIEVKAIQKSTHQVQYVNMPQGAFEAMTDEMREKLQEDPYGNIQ